MKGKNKFLDAVIAVTYRCNSRCIMCNIWKIKDNPLLTVEDIKKLPSSLRYINISGGEPFLRKDLVEIIKAVKEQCPKVKIIISSNGFLPSLIEKRMKQILKIDKNIGVAISLDGLENVHNKVRRIPNGFNKSVETLKILQSLGVKNLRIGFTAGDYNIDELPKVYNFAKKMGIEMTLAAVHNSDNFFQINSNKIEYLEKFKKNLLWLIRKELFSFSAKRWLRAYFAYGLLFFILKNKRILPSYAGEKSFFLDPNGNVYPSDISTQKLGNIKEFNNLEELISHSQARKVMSKGSNVLDHSWMICTARISMRNHPFRVAKGLLKLLILSIGLYDFR